MKNALIILVLFVVFLGYTGSALYAADSKKSPNGKVSKDLGQKAMGFGSSGQSQELLKLISSMPGKAEYEITYKTDVDTVVLKCDLSSNVLMRIHRYKDGRGKQEVWNGYVTERLRSAAAGGSLNDTPQGKSPGSFQSF